MFFWNSLAFLMIQRLLAIWSLVPSQIFTNIVMWRTLGLWWQLFCWLMRQHLKNAGNMHEILLSGYFREEQQQGEKGGVCPRKGHRVPTWNICRALFSWLLSSLCQSRPYLLPQSLHSAPQTTSPGFLSTSLAGSACPLGFLLLASKGQLCMFSFMHLS